LDLVWYFQSAPLLKDLQQVKNKAVLDSSAVEIKYQKHFGFPTSPWRDGTGIQLSWVPMNSTAKAFPLQQISNLKHRQEIQNQRNMFVESVIVTILAQPLSRLLFPRTPGPSSGKPGSQTFDNSTR
jgi:hypothetical protein